MIDFYKNLRFHRITQHASSCGVIRRATLGKQSPLRSAVCFVATSHIRKELLVFKNRNPSEELLCKVSHKVYQQQM